MKKISILCLVLLIIALVGVQVVGNETDQLMQKETNRNKTEKSSEVILKNTSVKTEKPEEKEDKSKKKEAPQKIELIRIRMEDGYENSLNNLDYFKEELRGEKVQIVLTYNDKEFAKGYVGLNDQRNSLEFIYFAHTEHQEKPEYVERFNEFRKVIYNVKY